MGLEIEVSTIAVQGVQPDDIPHLSPIAHRPSPIAHRPSPIAHRQSPITHHPHHHRCCNWTTSGCWSRSGSTTSRSTTSAFRPKGAAAAARDTMSVKLYVSQVVLWFHPTESSRDRGYSCRRSTCSQKAIGTPYLYVVGPTTVDLCVKKMVAHGRWHRGGGGYDWLQGSAPSSSRVRARRSPAARARTIRSRTPRPACDHPFKSRSTARATCSARRAPRPAVRRAARGAAGRDRRLAARGRAAHRLCARAACRRRSST